MTSLALSDRAVTGASGAAATRTGRLREQGMHLRDGGVNHDNGGHAARSAAQQMRVRTTLDRLNVRLLSPPAETNERQQRRLLLSGLYLQNILEQATDAVFVTDRQGILTLWNHAAEQMFGVTAEAVVGRHIDSVEVACQSDMRLLDLVTALTPDMPAQHRDFRCRTPAGDRELDVSLSLVRDPVGAAIAVSGIVRDVTERNALHRELARKAEELAASSRHTDEFLAVLSHELRTPLNTVMGWAQILLTTPHDAERVERAATIIRRNTDLQQRLVVDLLDYARISAGRLNLQLDCRDVAALARATVAALRPELDNQELTVIEHYTEALARVDPEWIGQVFSNLLSNAMKFTPPGGRIHIRVGRTADRVEAEVSDSGRGIAPEFLPYLFEAFRQAEASAHRAEHGLGLGLAISCRVVELHGGRIEAHSDGTGKGATFTVTLPAAGPDEAAVAPPASS